MHNGFWRCVTFGGRRDHVFLVSGAQVVDQWNVAAQPSPDMAAASDPHPIGWTLIGTTMWIGLDSEIR